MEPLLLVFGLDVAALSWPQMDGRRTGAAQRHRPRRGARREEREDGETRKPGLARAQSEARRSAAGRPAGKKWPWRCVGALLEPRGHENQRKEEEPWGKVVLLLVLVLLVLVLLVLVLLVLLPPPPLPP